jgi:conjugal transfer pilin signal peptidase TrbI
MSAAVTEARRSAGRARRYFFYTLGCVVALAAWRSVDDMARSHMFVINRTPSLPNWAFVIDRTNREPARGEVAYFVPPRNPLVQAHFGNKTAFGKIVYGLPGDRIERHGDRAFIMPKDGTRTFEVARLKPVSSRGEPLEAGPTGVIPNGCYYMGSPHKDGFDSRYAAVGFVCNRQIVGTATKAIL